MRAKLLREAQLFSTKADGSPAAARESRLARLQKSIEMLLLEVGVPNVDALLNKFKALDSVRYGLEDNKRAPPG